jgi:hypothetical protein
LLLAVEGRKHAKVLDLPIIGRIMKGAVWKGPSDDCTEKDRKIHADSDSHRLRH